MTKNYQVIKITIYLGKWIHTYVDKYPHTDIGNIYQSLIIYHTRYLSHKGSLVIYHTTYTIRNKEHHTLFSWILYVKVTDCRSHGLLILHDIGFSESFFKKSFERTEHKARTKYQYSLIIQLQLGVPWIICFLKIEL